MDRAIPLAALALTALAAACDTEQAAQDQPGERSGETLPTRDESAALETDVTLAIDTLQGAGAYLTDGDGRALYLFTGDSAGTSTCYDACADAWPPLLAENGASAGTPDLQQSLVGTTQREDGRRQVTYGGHPLYHFSSDAGPADTAGQDVEAQGGEWYLVTPAGRPLETGPAEEEQGETP